MQENVEVAWTFIRSTCSEHWR